MEDIYTLKTSAFPSSVRVMALRGVEAISRPFRFEVFVTLAVDDAQGLDLMQAVGAKATLAMHADRKDAFTFQGILSVVEFLHAHASYVLLRAVLEPRFVRLKLTEHSKIFTNQSVPDIIKAVLEDNGLTSEDYAIQLTGSYATEEHVCQYHETDFAFLSRWMEHLGIYYFFTHDGDQEKLVIADDKSAHTAMPSDPVRYFPVSGGVRSGPAGLETFRCKATTLPASVTLRDYDYTKPTLDVSGTANVASNGVGDISIYGVRAFAPADAAAFAKLRAGELLARQVEHTGASTTILHAGFTFTLDEHPMDAFNAEYLATEVEHFGNLISQLPDLAHIVPLAHPDVYRCDVTAIPGKVQFRPIRATPWPRIYGFEHGTIDGEADSDYAQIDDHGRYKVKFAFDESDLKSGKGSTWVRMMQPHGGGIEGFHFPQRKNTEVVFAFMGGDPDRPVIAGVVNNTQTPSPVTSGNATRNVIQTGGRNRIEIEDKAGQERVSISSPHANSYIRMGSPNDDAEMHVNTDGSGIIHTKVNLTVNVDANLTEHTQGTVTQNYDQTQDLTVKGAVHEIYKAGQKSEITGTREMQVTGPLTEHATGVTTQDYDSAHMLTTGARTDHVKGTLTQTADGAHMLTTGARTDHVKGPFGFTADGPITITAPAKTETLTGPTSLFANSSAATFTYGAKFSMDFSASLSLFMGVKLSAEASIAIGATAGLKASFGSAVDLRSSPIQTMLGGVMVTLTGSASIDVVTPTLLVPAAAIVFV